MDKLLFTVEPAWVFLFKVIEIIFVPIIGVGLLFALMFPVFIYDSVMIIPFLFIMFIVFIILCIVLFCDYLNYQATKYKVYDDSVEFEEGFINHKYATLKWIDIKEIHFTQNFLQRIFGIGHIKFITAANTGYNGYNDGIKFRDVQNPKEIYDKLKSIHNSVHA